VGADGAGSGTRRAVGLEFQGHTWPVRFVATNVLHNFELDGYGHGNFVIDPHHWAIIVILGRGDLWRLTLGESNELPLETLKDRMSAKYRHFTGADIVDRITAYSPYRVHERAAERFREGRVLLAGDAALAKNPCGGFGLTSGLLDAAALGYPLAAVFHGKQDTTILDRYAMSGGASSWRRRPRPQVKICAALRNGTRNAAAPTWSGSGA
jgi:2-polyprenyl-6-methoxyphenol hydroxylase-like FAD-dependent oxidoreductase